MSTYKREWCRCVPERVWLDGAVFTLRQISPPMRVLIAPQWQKMAVSELERMTAGVFMLDSAAPDQIRSK
jgi:hypothetical protein